MIPTIPQLALVLVLTLSFVHYLQAGARTFVMVHGTGETGAALGALTFSAGALVSLSAGVYLHMETYRGIAGAVLAVGALSLYEWARRTIVGRRFHVGLSERVPEEVCEVGPYAFIRHPVYTSYMLTYLALLAAFPHWITGVLFVVNVVLFGYMARNDERVLAGSALGARYAGYRKRVGKFFPRLSYFVPPLPPSRR